MLTTAGSGGLADPGRRPGARLPNLDRGHGLLRMRRRHMDDGSRPDVPARITGDLAQLPDLLPDGLLVTRAPSSQPPFLANRATKAGARWREPERLKDTNQLVSREMSSRLAACCLSRTKFHIT